MRHQLKRHRIARGASHRKATLAALSTALIKHKRIKTTISKAKALRVFVEPILNRAKEDSTHNRREVFRHLQDKYAVTELFTEIAGKITDRSGGYTRVIKLGARPGDAAEMAVIELVDYNDVKPGGAAGGRRRRTRRGGGGAGKKEGASGNTGATQPGAGQAQMTNVSSETAAVAPKSRDLAENTTEASPVAAEQTEPVVERTEPNAEAKEIAAEQAAEPAQDQAAEPAEGEQTEGDEKTA